jgi:hypothetical protein
VAAPDLEDTTRDPRETDKWDQDVSCSKKRGEEKEKEVKKWAGSSSLAQKKKEAQEDFRPVARFFLFFFIFTALTRGSHLSKRPTD